MLVERIIGLPFTATYRTGGRSTAVGSTGEENSVISRLAA
jgi:hypothetical protein